ncbi:MAG TPA: PilZ domain-containing protein [Gammaproteobacteria bacterium]|nr:PilZ domain-containing protein [Gammaproteobacteria bacterium]
MTGIEHRWSERKPINMEVEIFYTPMGMVPGRTRDVSLEGMFVETGGVHLPRHARLEVTFRTAGHQGPCEHRVPAYVVHGNERGVGLMLDHIEPRGFRALRYVLNAA